MYRQNHDDLSSDENDQMGSIAVNRTMNEEEMSYNVGEAAGGVQIFVQPPDSLHERSSTKDHIRMSHISSSPPRAETRKSGAFDGASPSRAPPASWYHEDPQGLMSSATIAPPMISPSRRKTAALANAAAAAEASKDAFAPPPTTEDHSAPLSSTTIPLTSPPRKKATASKDAFAVMGKHFAMAMQRTMERPAAGQQHSAFGAIPSALELEAPKDPEQHSKRYSQMPLFGATSSSIASIPSSRYGTSSGAVDIHSVQPLFGATTSSPLTSQPGSSDSSASNSAHASQVPTAQRDWTEQLAAERAERQRSIDANTLARNERLARLAKCAQIGKEVMPKATPTSLPAASALGASPFRLKSSPPKNPSGLTITTAKFGPSLSLQPQSPGIAPPLSPNSRLQNQAAGSVPPGAGVSAVDRLQNMKAFGFGTSSSRARHQMDM